MSLVATSDLATEGLRFEEAAEGALWRLQLAAPPGNVLDRSLIAALTRVFVAAHDHPSLKTILLTAEGRHFSFGASVAEHLPGEFETMIPAFTEMCRAILRSPVPFLVAVQGHCLGGALEVATLATRLVAAPRAQFGQPEIVLGVFPPIAAACLALRTGQMCAEEICLSGRNLDTDEALRIGLIDAIADEPDAVLLAYAKEHLLSRSASSLRLTQTALRAPHYPRWDAAIAAAETLYCDALMRTHDAVEGLAAFTEKRAPQWTNQ